MSFVIIMAIILITTITGTMAVITETTANRLQVTKIIGPGAIVIVMIILGVAIFATTVGITKMIDTTIAFQEIPGIQMTLLCGVMVFLKSSNSRLRKWKDNRFRNRKCLQNLCQMKCKR
jgi:Ca2+/Na+ antiporter